MAAENAGELIELLSDDDEDDEVTVVEDMSKRRQRTSKVPNECLNVQCKSGEKFIEGVPAFVRSYYKVRNGKNLKVCEKCFNEACSYYMGLKDRLLRKESICNVPCPPYSSVLNIDSDEEDSSPDDDETSYDKETIVKIEDELSDVMYNVMTKCNVTFQVNDVHNMLQRKVHVSKDITEEHDAALDNMQIEIDKIRNIIYEGFTPIINELPSLDINDVQVSPTETPAVISDVEMLEETSPKDTSPPVALPSVPKPQPKPKEVETVCQTARKSVSCKLSAIPSLSNLQKENKPPTESKDSQDVVAVSEEVMEPPANLPPPGGNMSRPELKPGDIIFAMKHNYKYAWKKGVVVNIFNNKGFNKYQLKIDVTNPRKSNPSKILPGQFLAYPTPASTRFTVGMRIIAGFREENSSNGKLQYYSGVIAEPPKVVNRFSKAGEITMAIVNYKAHVYLQNTASRSQATKLGKRYLVFFDDGCAQYVPHEHIRLICEPSPNACDDVPPESRTFIRNYLLEYPERPMVKLQVGDSVKVECEGVWCDAVVEVIDASLVKMKFSHSDRVEWIYRGSTRLATLFNEIKAAKHRMQTGERVRRIVTLKPNSPYVVYTREEVDGDVSSKKALPESISKIRNVAKKSTSANREQNDKKETPVKWTPLPIPGKVEAKKLQSSIKPKKFLPHQCGSTCISWTNYNPDKIRDIGPLAIPLNYGFRRLIYTFSGNKHSVIYKAPCGRQLRNMEEVHLYLRITKSLMTVDFFDFDYWVRSQAEFVIQKCILDVPDISQRKEKCPISCVNYIDDKLPDFVGYMTAREPRENVSLNLDPEFLCGCDCTDDCRDKSKCSCWQLTIEGQKLIPNNIMDPNVGYSYRRLTERVITGIYECNQQCKCSKLTCLNRVVQHPLSQKLQLFKTEMKGWGLRCLNDIPQGAFICVYAGNLLTEQEANEEGKNYGDEYLAELDYIEVIERIKEDYESDIPDELKESDDESVTKKKDKKQFPVKSSSHKTHSPDSSSSEEMDVEPTVNYGDIRSRLRERKKPATPPPQPEPPPKKEMKKKQRFNIRRYCGDNEDDVFIMDAKTSGNIGRYLNHSCAPNVFVQNVFVDTHDLRFPWVAFFALTHIVAGSELTWDYNYDIGSVEGKIKYCYCGSDQCRGRLL